MGDTYRSTDKDGYLRIMPLLDSIGPRWPARVSSGVVGPATTLVVPTYEQLACKDLPSTLYRVPVQLHGCVDSIYAAAGRARPVYAEQVQPGPSMCGASPGIAVLFSGGNDSVATAIKCKELGVPVYLYHVYGINRSYQDEYAYASRLAVALGLPLHTGRVSVTGVPARAGWCEHPMKDQLLMAMAMDAMHHRCQLVRYTTGNESETYAKESNVEYNWSDSVEMHEGASHLFRAAMPQYTLEYYIQHRSDSVSTIVRHSEKLLNMTKSCMTPYRFQAMRRRQNMERYGVALRDNRCGSCYKCCAEYLNTVALGIDSPMPDFIRHCFNFFRERVSIVYGPGVLEGAGDTSVLHTIVDRRFIDPRPLYEYLID